MRNIICGALFVVGICLAGSDSPDGIFPVPNIIGLGMLAIVTLIAGRANVN